MKQFCSGGAVAGADLPAGLASQTIDIALLADMLHSTDIDKPVVVVADGAGALCPAAAALRAAPAPHHRAAALLLGAGAGAGGVRLRLAGAARAGDPLPLWFDDHLLAALHIPYLKLHHIRGRNDYWCESCDSSFSEPNWLKLHLWLRCAPFSRRAFWSRALRRLAAAPPAPPPAPPPPAPTTDLSLSSLAATAAAAEAWAAAAGGAAHACVYCGKAYSRRYGLKIHIRTHTGYKPLRCRVCQRPFADPSNLNKHARLHARS